MDASGACRDVQGVSIEAGAENAPENLRTRGNPKNSPIEIEIWLAATSGTHTDMHRIGEDAIMPASMARKVRMHRLTASRMQNSPHPRNPNAVHGIDVPVQGRLLRQQVECIGMDGLLYTLTNWVTSSTCTIFQLLGEFKASFCEWFWSRFWAMVFDFVASKTGQWFPRRFSTWFSQPRAHVVGLSMSRLKSTRSSNLVASRAR